MRALIVCGSGSTGFTSVMCSSFADGLNLLGIGCETVRPDILDIRHCTGCGECSKTGECILDDDGMEAIYESFRNSDLLVLASPIRFSGPSSLIKTVIDRFQPMWYKDSGHPGYVAAMLSGGSMSPNFTNTVSIFKAFSITAGAEWLGHMEVPDTDNKKAEDVSKQSFEYGKEMGQMLIKGRR